MSQSPRRFGPRHAAVAVAAVAWAALAAEALTAGPSDPVAACAASVYRDPVTGRAAGLGGTVVAPDGRVTCRRPGHGIVDLFR